MSGETGDDQLTLSIVQMLNNFSYIPSTPSIYRVNDCLRSANEKAYDPKIIAIGPFHREKDHLKNMEYLKIRYLKMVVRSGEEPSVNSYVKVIRDLEQEARKCYAEVITLEREEFVKMLLLDGIFIIEFLREYDKFAKGIVVSSIFQFQHVVRDVCHDLMLLENQVPFFVLEGIFNLSKHNEEKISDLIRPLVLPSARQEIRSPTNADHLLGLVHYANCSSFALKLSSQGVMNVAMKHLNSATELKEAGIVFKPKDEGTSWLDIEFRNKKIYFPLLSISDDTESRFRNMIAYEYNLPWNRPRYITDYVFFLHCLIHSPKDAQLLRSYGIISNWLGGGDEMVYHLINKLGTYVYTSHEFSYLDVFHRINRHCGHRRNRWIAILRRNYFNSPWKLISFVAAIILLSVAVAQMVFAILSYRHDLKS